MPLISEASAFNLSKFSAFEIFITPVFTSEVNSEQKLFTVLISCLYSTSDKLTVLFTPAIEAYSYLI